MGLLPGAASARRGGPNKAWAVQTGQFQSVKHTDLVSAGPAAELPEAKVTGRRPRSEIPRSRPGWLTLDEALQGVLQGGRLAGGERSESLLLAQLHCLESIP